MQEFAFGIAKVLKLDNSGILCRKYIPSSVPLLSYLSHLCLLSLSSLLSLLSSSFLSLSPLSPSTCLLMCSVISVCRTLISIWILLFNPPISSLSKTYYINIINYTHCSPSIQSLPTNSTGCLLIRSLFVLFWRK